MPPDPNEHLTKKEAVTPNHTELQAEWINLLNQTVDPAGWEVVAPNHTELTAEWIQPTKPNCRSSGVGSGYTKPYWTEQSGSTYQTKLQIQRGGKPTPQNRLYWGYFLSKLWM